MAFDLYKGRPAASGGLRIATDIALALTLLLVVLMMSSATLAKEAWLLKLTFVITALLHIMRAASWKSEAGSDNSDALRNQLRESMKEKS
jgi:TRAP-type uncharacterized transport system fused permease subunit